MCTSTPLPLLVSGLYLLSEHTSENQSINFPTLATAQFPMSSIPFETKSQQTSVNENFEWVKRGLMQACHWCKGVPNPPPPQSMHTWLGMGSALYMLGN
eukprot:1154832-Pelagomonas_calceolata.AAC.2